MSASRHTVENIINALIRGQAFIAPSELYISLHTADPGATGSNEIDLTSWPSYARQDSLQGDTLGNAWKAADGEGISWNQKQMIFPVFDGPTGVVVTHFGIWNAASNGIFLASGQLTTPREVGPSQVFVADTDKLGVKVS